MFAAHPEADLIPYLRDQLNRHERIRVADHLEGCVECRARLESLADTLRLVAQQIELLPAPDPRAYQAELRRKLTGHQGQATRRRLWRPSYVWGSFAAAGLAVAMVAFIALRVHGPGMRLLGPQSIGPLALADADADVMAKTDVGLLRNYSMVERLDMLDDDNYDVIEHLDELAPTAQTNEIKRL